MKIKVINLKDDVAIVECLPNMLERYFGKQIHNKKLVKNTDKNLSWNTTLNKEYFFVDENLKEYYLEDEIKLYRRKENYFNTVRKHESEFNKRKQEIEDRNKCVCDLVREGKVDSGYCGECKMHWG